MKMPDSGRTLLPWFCSADLGPTDAFLKPMGDLDFEEAVSIYTEVVKAGVRGGADRF